MDAKDLELIQQALDGDVDPAEAERLTRLLERDPEAARSVAELRAVAGLLEDWPEQPPPPELRGAVRREIWKSRDNATVRDRSGEGFVMSKKWVAFAAGLAAVVAVVLWFGIADRTPEDTVTGAIGAVEKHRAPQIDAGDVVLGGSEAAATYVDWTGFLGDAAVLRNASAELGAMASKSLEARAADVDRISGALAARQAEVMARYELGLKAQLAAYSRVLEARDLGLEAKTLERVRGDLAAASRSLEAKTLDARTLESARQQLESIHRELGARLMQLEQATSLQGARTELEAVNRDLENRAATLDARTLESRVQTADRALEARNLALEARTLEARRANLEQMSLAAKAFEARSGLGAKADGLESASRGLLEAASQLEARSLEQMRRNLEAGDLEQRTLLGMKDTLGAAERGLEARSNGLEARSLESMRQSLGAVSHRLESASLEASQRLVGEMRLELGSARDLLDNRSLQLEASTLDGLGSQLQALGQRLEAKSLGLEARTMLQARDELGAATRSLESRRAELGQGGQL